MRTLHPSRNILHLNYSSHGTGLTFVEKLVYLLWMSFLVPVFPILLNICMFIDSLPSLLIWLHWEAVYRRGDVQTDLTWIISLFVLTAVQQVLNPVFFSMRRSMRMVVWVLEKSFRSAITSQCPNGVSSQVDQGFMRCITDAVDIISVHRTGKICTPCHHGKLLSRIEQFKLGLKSFEIEPRSPSRRTYLSFIWHNLWAEYYGVSTDV